jgi:hypothetical protein
MITEAGAARDPGQPGRVIMLAIGLRFACAYQVTAARGTC